MICNKDCFHCPFSDCINDEYGPEELAMVIAFEEAAGIVFRAEKDMLYEEIIEACEIQRKAEKARRSAAIRKAKSRKNADRHKPYINPSAIKLKRFYGGLCKK